MATDDVRTLISVVALAISAVALMLTRVNWKQSNRPVVSAFLVDDKIGIGVATFNLSVANTGTRPATNVVIFLEPAELEKLLDPAATGVEKMSLARCFARDSKIPLLRNGEVLTGAIGHSSRVAGTKAMLAYGAEATAKLTYEDLEGNRYEARQPIKVYAREGFTGVSWQSAA